MSPDNTKGTADTDDDGYPDYMDLCPTQPETFNGIDDKDGCPDDASSLRDALIKTAFLILWMLVRIQPETYNKFQDD